MKVLCIADRDHCRAGNIYEWEPMVYGDSEFVSSHKQIIFKIRYRSINMEFRGDSYFLPLPDNYTNKDLFILGLKHGITIVT